MNATIGPPAIGYATGSPVMHATGLHAVAEHWLHNGLVVQQAPCCATERAGHLFLAFARPEITAASRIEMNRIIHYACMHVLCTQGVTV